MGFIKSDVPLFLKQTSKARLPERALRGSGRWCGPQEASAHTQQAFLGTRATYTLPRECPLGPGLQWPKLGGTAPACCQPGVGVLRAPGSLLLTASHQQNTQAAVRGGYEEHHWPCLTRVATVRENAKGTLCALHLDPQPQAALPPARSRHWPGGRSGALPSVGF